ncbi:hypothetical protein [Flavobacterium mekongense]|uniref:hypothetical protein n=1 Tax=Flavobacterium mekongense TaxID=3379707 RepID=UPI0039997731
MKTKETIILKIFGISATAFFCWSLIWESLIYLYGGLYYPLKEFGLQKKNHFEVFVALLSLIIIALVVFKLKGKTLLKVMVQDFLLVIISVPFFAVIFGYFRNEEPKETKIMYAGIFALTIFVINFNDWFKLKKPAANSC